MMTWSLTSLFVCDMHPLITWRCEMIVKSFWKTNLEPIGATSLSVTAIL